MYRSMELTLVEVTVEIEEQKSFMIHKDLLCYHSTYFHSAFHGNFRESEEKAIDLPDVAENIFKIFQS